MKQRWLGGPLAGLLSIAPSLLLQCPLGYAAETPPPRAQVSAPGAAAAFDDLPGVGGDDLAAAFAAFRASCAALADNLAPKRAAVPPSSALRAICRKALSGAASLDRLSARAFFTANFLTRRLTIPAFLTGYYEPVVEGSLTKTSSFTTPLLAVPQGFIPAAAGAIATRRLADDASQQLPDRAGIEAGALGDAAEPLVWLRQPVDAFFVQVQGSARVMLPDGTMRRLAYAGRNGFPYTSIGKVLVDTLHIPPERMGMSELKGWIHAHGQGVGDAGTALMLKNRSYIFFRFDDSLPAGAGPVGAEGVSLTALRSLAIDRTAWSYGLPFYVSADLPWQGDAATPFQRLMVAQDTGSAIVGPARADIFFGTGPQAAAHAGAIRQPGTLFVLWPRDSGEGGAGTDGKAPG